MEISPDNLAQVQHQDWLHHPCTIQMIKLLDEHKASFVDGLAKSSPNFDIPDANFRSMAYAVFTIDTIKLWVTNTNVFVQKTIKPKPSNRK